MVRLIFFMLFATAFAATALTIRACSTLASHADSVPFEQAKKIAVLADGSVMFAPDGTVARELTDWLEQPDGDSRWFELGGTQFEGRSVEPTAFTMKRLPRLAQMLKAYPRVKARLVGHAGATADARGDLQLSLARAEWAAGWLVRNGVAAGRVSADGIGSNHPLFAMASPQAGRNDRVSMELSFAR